ncbi:MAG: tetratricopeptide repeat protein [Coriobacteriia bacterium]|nr:tetratricopeptide repeat protein [Coriobacteriia bacterium]
MNGLLARARVLWRNRTIRLAIYVTGLAVLMLGLGALALDRRSDQGTEPTLPPGLESGYDRALALAESGETTAALETLTAYLMDNPADERARTLVVRLTQGQDNDNGSSTPPDDDTPDPGETPPGDTEWLKAVADMEKLLPSVVDGLSRGSVVKSTTSAVVPYDPAIGGPYEGTRRVLYSVHDLKDAKSASSYATQVSKVVYAKNGQSTTVDGAQAYFGTNGRSLATVSYARGRYVFEVVVTTALPPAGFKQQSVEIAKAFPDTIK